jgi:hypothetical protein
MKVRNLSLSLSIAVIVAAPDPAALAQENKPPVLASGWPGYRHHVLDDLAVVDVSAVVSWNLYKAAQGRFELPHIAHDRLSVGAQVMYQDLLHVNYFGLGNDSLKSDRSGYRFNNTDVLGYATARAATWVSVSGRFLVG